MLSAMLGCDRTTVCQKNDQCVTKISSLCDGFLITLCEPIGQYIMPAWVSSESIGLIRNLSCWNAGGPGNPRPEDECEDTRDQVYRLDSP